MKPIQLILFALLAGGLLTYFAALRSRLRDRLLVGLVGLLGAAMVAHPDGTTEVANLVGVVRGADLVIYLSLLGLGFICLLLFSKLRESEHRQTELARALALSQPHQPDAGLAE
jgi:hypothetical protein